MLSSYLVASVWDNLKPLLTEKHSEIDEPFVTSAVIAPLYTRIESLIRSPAVTTRGVFRNLDVDSIPAAGNAFTVPTYRSADLSSRFGSVPSTSETYNVHIIR